MRIRKLKNSEICFAKDLWQYCFQDSDAFTDWYFARKAGAVLGAFDGERLAAQLVLAPLALAVRGERREGRLVSGVSTRPEYRGQGAMGQLLPASYARMRREGACIAVLYPFSYGFYRQYGWAVSCDAVRVRTALSDLPVASLAGGFELVEELTGPQLAALAAIYEDCFAPYSGHVLRGPGDFALRLEELAQDGGFAALYRRGEAVEGYLLYHFEGKVIAVDELGLLTPEARRDTLSFLGRHASTMEEAAWLAPVEDNLWRRAGEGRGVATLEPFAMARILDLEAAAQGLPAGAGRVILAVRDGQAPWNQDTWAFSAAAGRLCLERTGEQPEATLDIGPLGQWLLGYRSAGELAGEGLLPGAVAQRLDALLHKRPTFLYEMY